MPFSGGPQAENEPQSARRQVSLIGVRDNGGIEQRSGFQRIFGEETGADQQAPLIGYLLIERHQFAELFKSCAKDFVDVQVPLAEFSADFIQEISDLVLR